MLVLKAIHLKRTSVLLAGVMTATGLTMPVQAQEAQADAQASTGPGELEEIIVTARRRDEGLFEAPLSITTMTAADIERANIQDITSIAQFSPGFYYTPQVTFSSSRVAPSYRFRGMNNGSNDPLQQLGGTFVDGVYLFGGAQSLTMDDIERVEVIKGPQSALFGRGTFAGAVNFITREPSSRFRTRVSGGVETRDSYSLGLSVEGPITDTLSFRLSGASNQRGAHFRTSDGGELGRETTHAINGQLLWRPNDAFRLRLRHSEAWQDDSKNAIVNMNASRPDLANAQNRCITGTQPYWCGAVPELGARGVPASVASVATSLRPPAFARSNNPDLIIDILNNNTANPLVVNGLPYLDKTPRLDHSGLAGRFTRTSVEAGYRFGNGIAIDAVFANSEMRTTTAQSTSNDNGNAWVISPNILRDTSVDVRVSSDQSSRFTWLMGANYFRQKSLGGFTGTGAIPSVHDNVGIVSYNETATFANQGVLESWSLFAAAGIELFEGLSFDAEARWISDDVTTSFQLPTAATTNYKNLSSRLILTYRPQEDLTFYGSWARGALPGTTNTSYLLLSPALQAQVAAYPGFSIDVPDERVDNFEIGVKQDLGRLRYALTGYHMRWRNLKNVVFTFCPGNVCGPTYFAAFAPTTFAQSANIWGIEAELNAVIARGWNVSLSGAYTSARYTRFFAPLAGTATGQTDASGRNIYGYPGLQGVFSSNYSTRVNDRWDGFVNTELTYTGRMYVDEVNQSWIDPSLRWNLRVGAESDGLRVEAYVENLLNDRTWLSGIRSTQSVYSIGTTSVSQASAAVVLPRLRTFGLRFTYTFN